ncbi:hypothetical protein [Leptolyngbya phage Lbo-JY16]
MIVPGSNILNMAFGLIASQPAVWYQATGRAQNAVGQFITTYAEPVVIRGSMQPMDRARYEALGLDMDKDYWSFHTAHPIDGVDRGKAPDVIEYNGNRYQITKQADWDVDGWRWLILIRDNDE